MRERNGYQVAAAQSQYRGVRGVLAEIFGRIFGGLVERGHFPVTWAGAVRKFSVLFSLCGMLAGCLGSGTEVAQGGGGSEAVALAGQVNLPGGAPAGAAHVRLRPKFFLPDTAAARSGLSGGPGGSGGSEASGLFNALTDSAGKFRLSGVKRGEYFLEVNDSGGRAVLIPCTLTGDSASVTLATAELKPTGAVTGAILAPDGFAGRAYVQVYGLDRLAIADSVTGQFNMPNLPLGTYTLRAVFSAPAVDARLIDSVQTDSAAPTDIGSVRLASFENENYTAWPKSQRIYLNTTPAAANVAGAVDDFPLLVRLNKSNFDFTQSRGNDIRFSDNKGKRLRYQVERWDTANAAADIWVRVDHITGGTNTQFITLHWGVPGAEDWSDGRQVFAVEAGFGGAWHLDEEAADTLGGDVYKDASGYDPAEDHILSSDREGVVGWGHGFNSGDFAMVQVADPILEPNARLTVSAWVRSARTGAAGGTILSMGENFSLRINPDGSLRFAVYAKDLKVVESKGLNLLDSAWHLVCGTYDGAALAIYADGKPVGNVAATGTIAYNFWPSFVLGKNGNRKTGYEFAGSLDEVEVSSETARSADWIKLSYASQRAGSTLLEFRP